MAGRPAIRTATVAASLVAGPAFLLGVGIVGLAESAGETLNFQHEILVMVPASIVTIPFGALLAVIPCIIGVSLLSRIAAPLEAMRLPVVWALIGGLAGLAIEQLAFGIAGVMAFTGAICALTARRFLKWDDQPRSG